MKKISTLLTYAFILIIFLFACSTTSTITADENAISIAMGDTKDFNEAVSDAAKKAEKHCSKYDKTAKLERTEKAGKKDRAGIAYFICEAKAGE